MKNISRRSSLVGIAASAIALSPVSAVRGLRHAALLANWQAPQVAAARVEQYLRQLARDDGGYAWDEQTPSHLTPTYAVIGCSRLLGVGLPDEQRVADFVRSHHPASWKKLEQEHREFELQQIQSLIWLGQATDEFRELVSGWREPVPYLKQYERNGIPIFRHQVASITARRLLDMSTADLDSSFKQYVVARRRANGSFNNTPSSDGSDGHVLNTLWGLQALQGLNQSLAGKRTETVAWLQQCLQPNGGFTWQPEPQFARATNITYTWAAVAALSLLDAKPQQPQATIDFILQHFNADGGFADRMDWHSNPLATYYALDALNTLSALDQLPRTKPSRNSRPDRPQLSSDLKVFSIQIEAHGAGSPADAVHLARSLKIDMWGAKNPKPGWIEAAQALADGQRAPVKFFVANEEYGTWIDVPGLGTYSHMSDIVAPDVSASAGSLANSGSVSWPEFQQRRVRKLITSGGRMVWQFGENEELVRLLLDDSLASSGFAMISTFHFGNPDFTNTEPFLQHYRGQIPFIALQDAHGAQPWWFADMTTGFRTLFLAHEPTWEGWLRALENHWTVAVRKDEQSHNRLLMHSSSHEVSEFVRERSKQWQWWDNDGIARPLLSLVAVSSQDEWETGRPQRGISLRVRRAWSNTNQGQLKEPLAELVSLVVDNQPVEPTKQTALGGRNAKLLGDETFTWAMPDAVAGGHTATASVRELATGALQRQTINF